MNSLYLKLIAGAAGIIVVLGLVLYIQHLQGSNAKLTLERNEARTELAGAKRSMESLQRSAIERQADNTRIDAAEKVLSDEIQQIQTDIAAGKTVDGDAYALAVSCARRLRAGQTETAAYRNSCR